MNIAEEIKKIDSVSATAVATFFLSLLGPSLLVVFHFERELFTSLDTIKLILLSISLSAPGVFIPYITTGITISVLKHSKKISGGQFGSAATWFQKHGFNNSVNMYLSLFVVYIFSLPFEWFAWFFSASIFFASSFEIVHLVRLSMKPEKYIPIQTS